MLRYFCCAESASTQRGGLGCLWERKQSLSKACMCEDRQTDRQTAAEVELTELMKLMELVELITCCSVVGESNTRKHEWK